MGESERVRCRKCRRILLSKDEYCLLDAHGEEYHDTVGDNNSKLEDLCPSVQEHSCLYLSEESFPDFILNAVDESSWTKGKLHCPGCHARIGSFNFVSGGQCACGAVVLPQVHILRSKVDWMKIGDVLPRPVSYPDHSVSMSSPSLPLISASDKDSDAASARDGNLMSVACCEPDSTEINQSSTDSSPSYSSNDAACDRSDIKKWCRKTKLKTRKLKEDICMEEQGMHGDVERTRIEVGCIISATETTSTLPVETVCASFTKSTSTSHSKASSTRSSSTSPVETVYVSPTKSTSTSLSRISSTSTSPIETVCASPTKSSSTSLSKISHTSISPHEAARASLEFSMPDIMTGMKPCSFEVLDDEVTSCGEEESSDDIDNHEDTAVPESLTCAVCLDLLYSPLVTRPCFHTFCEPCLRRLARPNPTHTCCPLCRRVIGHCMPAPEVGSEVRQRFPQIYRQRRQFELQHNSHHLPLPWLRNFRFGDMYETRQSWVERAGGWQVVAVMMSLNILGIGLLLYLGRPVKVEPDPHLYPASSFSLHHS